jgi:hypothetical protein
VDQAELVVGGRTGDEADEVVAQVLRQDGVDHDEALGPLRVTGARVVLEVAGVCPEQHGHTKRLAVGPSRAPGRGWGS